ncbi:hypothetical protein SUDANB21_06790 (plasmid) [Streptomyces sp. enrichment culture]
MTRSTAAVTSTAQPLTDADQAAARSARAPGPHGRRRARLTPRPPRGPGIFSPSPPPARAGPTPPQRAARPPVRGCAAARTPPVHAAQRRGPHPGGAQHRRPLAPGAARSTPLRGELERKPPFMARSFFEQPREQPHTPYTVARAALEFLGDQWTALPGPWGTTGHLRSPLRIPFTVGVCEAGHLRDSAVYARPDTSTCATTPQETAPTCPTTPTPTSRASAGPSPKPSAVCTDRPRKEARSTSATDL